MGRKRKPPGEVVGSICINLQQKILDEFATMGNTKHVIEKILTDVYMTRITEKNITDKDSEI